MGAGGAKGAKGAKGGCNRCAPIAPIAPTAPIAPNLPAWLSSSAAATATAAIAALEAAATTAAPTHRLGPRLVDHQGAPFHLEFVQLGDSLLSFLVAGHFNEPESTCPARGHVAHDARAFHGPRPAEELGKLSFAGLIRKVPHVQLATHNTDSSVPCGTHKKSRSGPDGPHRSFTSKRCASVETEAGESARSALRRYRRSGVRQFSIRLAGGRWLVVSGWRLWRGREVRRVQIHYKVAYQLPTPPTTNDQPPPSYFGLYSGGRASVPPKKKSSICFAINCWASFCHGIRRYSLRIIFIRSSHIFHACPET